MAMTYPQRVLFVDMAWLKKVTPLNEAVDENLIWPAMYNAQQEYLAPYLGDNLFEYLKAKITLEQTTPGSLTGNYLLLTQNYVIDVVAWWTMVILTPDLAYKYDNGNLIQRSSEDTTPVSDDVMKDMLNRNKNRAVQYTQNMVRYLCENSSLFPEYTTQNAGQRCPRTNVNGTDFRFSRSRSMFGADHRDIRHNSIYRI